MRAINMENEVRLNIKLTADLLEKVKKAAKEKQLTVSSLTRLLLVNYVEQNESERKNTESKK
jgi:metal-responsive CopG/Arc/MetJ family transcriptional regulator